MSKIVLRDYQKECLDKITSYAKDKNITRQVAVLATGLGKTIIFGHLPSKVKARGKKTLVIAHREELLTQAKDKMLWIDPKLKIGIEQANKTADHSKDDVVVASVQSIGRKNSPRIQKFNIDDYGLIIIDEAHHATADTYKNVLEYFKVLKGKPEQSGIVLLGVTATPNRSDHTGLDTIFDKIVFNYGLMEGIKNGYLSDIKAFIVETETDISHVKSRMGDFMESQLAEAINNENRNRLIVETYQEKFDGTKALLFAGDVAHAQEMTDCFNQVNIPSACVIGATPKEERRQILKDFKSGKLRVLSNCQVATEGYDEPSIETILMARPTKSSVMFSQMCGRGTRLYDGKDALNLVDFVDNTGKNKIVTLPSLFGVNVTLKGTKGKKITKLIEQVDKIKEVNPDYDISQIADWDDEITIDKTIKEINIFEQAKPPIEVQQNSNFNWLRSSDGFKIELPPKDNSKVKIELKPNMLNQHEVVVTAYEVCIPSAVTGWKKFRKTGTATVDMGVDLIDGFKKGDKYIRNNFGGFKALISQSAGWRDAEPTEPQKNMLRKFGIPCPAGLTKGQASNLISKAIEEKKSGRRY